MVNIRDLNMDLSTQKQYLSVNNRQDGKFLLLNKDFVLRFLPRRHGGHGGSRR